MSVPPHLHARRVAARRARIRQRRRVGAGAFVVLAAGALVAALLVGAGGSGSRVDLTSFRAAKLAPVGWAGSKLPARVRRGALPSRDEQYAAVQRLVPLGASIRCGGGRGRYAALTFDDGPTRYTPKVIRMLRRRHMTATFFLVGFEVVAHPILPRAEARLGAVGDHTWSHPFLTHLPVKQIVSQIRDTRDEVHTTSGAPVLLFRPPYGVYDARVKRVVRSLGLLQVLWSVDSRDSDGADVKAIVRNVSAGLRPGAIILLHENRSTTIVALRKILPLLAKRGLKAVTVPQLLALDPPSSEQLRTGAC